MRLYPIINRDHSVKLQKLNTSQLTVSRTLSMTIVNCDNINYNLGTGLTLIIWYS